MIILCGEDVEPPITSPHRVFTTGLNPAAPLSAVALRQFALQPLALGLPPHAFQWSV